jgi:hypothetical protein
MSCTSTRTFHSLCNSGCTTNCCSSASAFSFRSLCRCPELEDNVFNNVANDYCNLFTAIFEENSITFLTLIDNLTDSGDIGININTIDPRFQTIPNKHCKVSFKLINTANLPTSSCTLITFIIENKILVANTMDSTCLPFPGNKFIFQINGVNCIVASP